MIDDIRRNKRKDFTSIMSDTYKDFAENTSIHGLKYTVKGGIAIYEKIFWIIVVLFGLIGAGYMTVLFWDRFTSNPTRTSILTAYAPTSSLPFPAVTLCNINRIMVSKVDAFIKKLDIPDDQEEIVRRAFPQLLAFTNPTSTDYNITDLTILHEVLIKNDFFDMNLVMKKISQTCGEMLVKCHWNFISENCSDIFEESLTPEGFCCSFNYSYKLKKSSKRTFFSGLDSGLTILLDTMLQSVQYSSLHSSGLKVILHSHYDYPGEGSVSKIISGGRLTYLQMMGTKIVCSKDIRRLSLDQRKCSYPEERTLQFFSEYGDTNCLTECDALFLFQKCDCVPYYIPFTNKPICNVTSIPCLDEAKQRTAAKSMKKCNCPSQCEDEFYDVMSTTTQLDYDSETISSSFFYNNNTLTEDSVVVHIYFSSDRQTILFRDAITSTIYLLSSFGGVYSLFLGCSFITIIEILYYTFFRFLVNLKILGKMEKPLNENSTKQLTKKPRNSKKLQVWTSGTNTIFIN